MRHAINDFSNGLIPQLFNILLEEDNRAGNAPFARGYHAAGMPAMNVKETPQGYTVELAALGASKEDFSIEINDEGNLHVKLTHQEETVDEKTAYLRREFSTAHFEQTLVLPKDVDKEKITAKESHGILTIDLPKLEPQMKIGRKVNIE